MSLLHWGRMARIWTIASPYCLLISVTSEITGPWCMVGESGSLPMPTHRSPSGGGVISGARDGQSKYLVKARSWVGLFLFGQYSPMSPDTAVAGQAHERDRRHRCFHTTPTTEQRDHYVSGAAKYAQLGPRAQEALLLSMMQGAELSNTRGVILVDLWPRVGDLSEVHNLSFVGMPVRAQPSSSGMPVHVQPPSQNNTKMEL